MGFCPRCRPRRPLGRFSAGRSGPAASSQRASVGPRKISATSALGTKGAEERGESTRDLIQTRYTQPDSCGQCYVACRARGGAQSGRIEADAPRGNTPLGGDSRPARSGRTRPAHTRSAEDDRKGCACGLANTTTRKTILAIADLQVSSQSFQEGKENGSAFNSSQKTLSRH